MNTRHPQPDSLGTAFPIDCPVPVASPAPGLEHLHPAYFAASMATGIVSIAAELHAMTAVARTLFALNIAMYLALWAIYALRLVRHRRAFLADLIDHARAVGFFTVIAATGVLGSQFVLFDWSRSIGLGLWIFGIGLWIVLIYGVLTLITVRENKPSLASGLNGGWLVAVVASQSVAILGVQLSPGLDDATEPVLLLCMVFWLGAGMLYLWLITMVFYRYTFFSLKADDLAPPYWINMGAVAISTLAGTYLIDAAHLSPLLTELLPFTKGVTLLFWATACWWIPMLLTLGVWRHGWCRFPLRYDPLYWGAVFPLGMYTVCTVRLAQVLPADYLAVIPRYFVFIALAAWALVFVGLCRAVFRTTVRRRSASFG